MCLPRSCEDEEAPLRLMVEGIEAGFMDRNFADPLRLLEPSMGTLSIKCTV